MNLPKRKIKEVIGIFTVVFFAFVMFELIHSLLNPDENKYFKETGDGPDKTVVFNSAILKKYYKNFTSPPYYFCSSFKLNKTAGEYRVFLIGEASVSGWPYNKGQSLMDKMQETLGKYSIGTKVKIYTVSFAGLNSSHAVEIIEQLGKYQPDLIILYTGHNEFYGYKGNTAASGIFKVFVLDTLEGLLINYGILKSIQYNQNIDDLELLLAFQSKDQIIHRDQYKYRMIKDQFYENILTISNLCKKNNTELILSRLADNLLLPPVGVVNSEDNYKADIIYNTAKMALFRDGNSDEAVSLLIESKELDGFRIRLPKDFSDCLKTIARSQKIALADLQEKFIQNSPNHIPGNDLFADYFHPNFRGLDLIAGEYSRLILQKFGISSPLPDEDLKTSEKYALKDSAYCMRDNAAAKVRIRKSASLIEKLNFGVSLEENSN